MDFSICFTPHAYIKRTENNTVTLDISRNCDFPTLDLSTVNDSEAVQGNTGGLSFTISGLNNIIEQLYIYNKFIMIHYWDIHLF